MAKPRIFTSKRDVNRLITDYVKRQMSLTEIAEKYDIAPTTARRYLMEQKVKMRSRGGANRA